MGGVVIPDVIVTPLRVIQHDDGDIRHCMKSTDIGCSGFGEAYFSEINIGSVKGWKKHSKMTLNLSVVIGNIQFVMKDDRPSHSNSGFYSVSISAESPCRLTVPPGVWMAFRALGTEKSLLVNIASIQHDPAESANKELSKFDFDWSQTD
jgi:dTDP-4-dehydrorhamnose 3,5-epimerase